MKNTKETTVWVEIIPTFSVKNIESAFYGFALKRLRMPPDVHRISQSIFNLLIADP